MVRTAQRTAVGGSTDEGGIKAILIRKTTFVEEMA